ncbi:DUF2062 domain-containing protein [Endozoicomonas ascidiicola]|uniref:DUF2062 domain-containing protein n=1 Tax=Endozoicomonas ascidiicola TaxID=1698521 RepID=UPI000837A3D0|nr:DUF2062 domain-containing protein [Endozoicomonas ascidiicola]
MAKKLIQRYLPEPHTIKENRYLRFLGSALHNANLWQLNRRSAATAFFVGIFVAFIPMPFQMVLAACLAILFRCNLPLSVALVWITNPLTMPAIFYFTYKIGCLILQVPVNESSFELTLQGLGSGLARIWKPLYLGSAISGVVLGFISYTMIRIIWRWNVIVNWRQRNKRRSRSN